MSSRPLQRLHFEFRRQSELSYEDKAAAYLEELMTAQSAAALQANIDAMNGRRLEDEEESEADEELPLPDADAPEKDER